MVFDKKAYTGIKILSYLNFCVTETELVTIAAGRRLFRVIYSTYTTPKCDPNVCPDRGMRW